MDEARKRREDVCLAWKKLIGPARRSKKPSVVPVGFNYAKAILDISHKKPGGYALKQIAFCMGVSEGAVEKYQRGGIPDHIGGEALWGLYENIFGKGAAKKNLTGSEHLEEWDEKTYLSKAKGRK